MMDELKSMMEDHRHRRIAPRAIANVLQDWNRTLESAPPAPTRDMLTSMPRASLPGLLVFDVQNYFC
eukprot:1514473-Amphidinium_carterae.1